VQQTRGSFRKFVLDHDLDVVQAARFMAMVSVVYADDLIACFDAKYRYKFWRPITVIRAGHTDGNAATARIPIGLRCSRRRRTTPSVYNLVQELTALPERALVHHPGRWTGHRQIPGDAEDQLHGSQPDRPG
jgi:hypothetical protein